MEYANRQLQCLLQKQPSFQVTKKGAPKGAPFVFLLAAAAAVVFAAAPAAVAVTVVEQATATAVAQQQDDQDDPANITATETIITHNQYLRKLLR